MPQYTPAFRTALRETRWIHWVWIGVFDLLGLSLPWLEGRWLHLPLVLQWGVWVAALLATSFLVYQTGKAAWEAERKKTIRLEEEAQPTLEIVFDRSAPQCVEDTPLNDADNPDAFSRTVRVGLINRGKRAAEGVRVDLAVLEPHRNPHLPLRLRRIHEQYAGHADPYATFDLNPSTEPTEYISVAHKRSDGNGSDYISLFYAGLSPNTVPIGEYRLLIVAHGRNNVPLDCRKWFKLWVSDGRVLHMRED